MPTFILYLITLNALTGVEVHREPISATFEHESECLEAQGKQTLVTRIRQQDGVWVIDVRECVRRDEITAL